MQFLGAVRILGILIILFSATLIPPIVVSILYADQAHTAFIAALVIIFGFGLLCWWSVRDHKQELKLRDGFVVVVLIWVVLSILAAVPLLLVDNPDMRVVDALFEATSGLTTTGATILISLDNVPPFGVVLSPATAMAGWDGYHRSGRGRLARPRNRRDAALPG